MTAEYPQYAHMAAIAHSVLDEGAADLLAGCTSMHDIMVVPRPIMDPPYDLVAIRAPGSMRPPSDGHVFIEPLPTTGRNDRMERPVADAVPLFWRFMIEKFGAHPPRRTGDDKA